MGYKPEKSEEPELPQLTVGFIIFAIIVLFSINFAMSFMLLPYGLELVIFIYIGWNIRRFYFGPWQVIQTAALISFNNWLKK